MTSLPARPHLDHLRRQARDLLRAARSGDSAAAARIDELTLAAAQRAIAREYGFASWARLKVAVDARTKELAELVAAFCVASIRDGSGRAARMLAATPEIADYNLATAAILGDVERVRAEIARDPEAVVRPEPGWGWTPLHAVCGSRWHRLDPARAAGLRAVAELLLDAGADPAGRTESGWSPLRCAVAGAANPDIARLLLDRGAMPDDHDIYLACFAEDDHTCLRLLLAHAGDVSASTALAASISIDDVEGVRLLLEAGVDPKTPTPADLYGSGHDDESPWPPIHAAIRSGCSTELITLLLDAGAETTEVDVFLAACLRGDRAAAQRHRVPLTDDDYRTLVRAAGTGNAAAVGIMLDFGFPLDIRGDDGGTALHAAAYSGSLDTVRLLLDRGADIESRDTTWNSTPLGWAIVGSGEQRVGNWIDTVRLLIDSGASTAEITLSPDDPKPPSPEIAELLRSYGIG
jgi:ankyrin repeat protein